MSTVFSVLLPLPSAHPISHHVNYLFTLCGEYYTEFGDSQTSKSSHLVRPARSFLMWPCSLLHPLFYPSPHHRFTSRTALVPWTCCGLSGFRDLSGMSHFLSFSPLHAPPPGELRLVTFSVMLSVTPSFLTLRCRAALPLLPSPLKDLHSSNDQLCNKWSIFMPISTIRFCFYEVIDSFLFTSVFLVCNIVSSSIVLDGWMDIDE